ncbi:sensor histidine kinase [Pelagicoccus mobilis]|uniref:histidine kinase n=1 Tax=Pelagicoccus mobilis TaxID=415221 RepID=A0A934RZZ6_9BACT|nr:sensor histidine kinase [Pelagicoccus mobilis]MBK1878655.1 sensor histidine kinase [Pelagicoccus mobilis]
MSNVLQDEVVGSDLRPTTQARNVERNSSLVFALFGGLLLVVALILPFALAERELSGKLSVLQVILWLGFAGAWVYQGFLLGKSGVGFGPEDPYKEKDRGQLGEIVFYLLGFGPVCFAYIYVTHLNTGYFGFNYVLLFIVAGFATLIFNLGTAILYLVYQCAAWVVLAYFMWGGWWEVVDSVTMFSGYLFSAMMFYIFRRERRSRARAFALSSKLDEANERLRATYRQAEELAATQERNRIAREIHDTIGHSLTVVNMQIETARALMEKDSSKASEFLEKAQEVTKKGLSDIRSSVASLRSSPLDGRTLADTVEELLETNQSGGLETRFELRGDPEKLPTAKEAALYRSAQEALTNVRKHAEAKSVGLELSYANEGKVTLSVADDGKGCSEVAGGFGIMGIRERIQLLDGTVTFSTSPGEGFRLSVSIPR